MFNHNLAGCVSATTVSARVAVPPPLTAPTVVTAPVLSGPALAGQVIGFTAGLFAGNPAPTAATQWLLDGNPIATETKPTYLPIASDAGAGRLAVRQTATNSQGSIPSTTAAITVNLAPAFTSTPAIQGTPTVGSASTFTAGAFTGFPTPSSATQWLLDDNPINLATGATYAPVAGDAGHTLKVRQTITNSQGSVSSTSAGVTVQAVAVGGFAVPTQTFTAGAAATRDLSQYVSGWTPGAMALMLEGVTLPTSQLSFDETTGILTYNGTGGAVTLSSLVLFVRPLTDVPTWALGMSAYQMLRLGTVANGKPRLEQVIPSDILAGGLNPRKVVTYSGGAEDRANRRLYVHGGGHNDCDNNGVYMLDLNGADQPTGWSVRAVSAQSAVQPGGTYADGKPGASHTYAGQCYDSITNKVYRFNGSEYNSGSTPNNNWAFNCATDTWATIASWFPSALGDCLVCDEAQRKVFILNHSGDWRFYRIDSNTMGGSGSNSQQQFDSVCAYDWTRSRALVVDGDGVMWLVTINWSAETITMASQGNTGVSGSNPGVIYDYERDVFWMSSHNRTNQTSFATVYEIHPTTFAVTPHATSGNNSGFVDGTDPDPDGYTGLYNRHIWIPEWRTWVIVPSCSDAAFALKLP